ncbi:MAG TPA: hypothetical protein VFY14_22185 [Streptomyces sp.]|nr:hypothetical protein [Streptomyces sp.]
MSTFEVTQPEIRTRPIAQTEQWELVMEAADYRCQCAGGLCGSQHSTTGLRCPAVHDQTHRKGHGLVRLIAAPVDLGLSDTEATAVPIQHLRAWCPACYAAARRRAREAYTNARRIEAGPEPTLF